MAYYIFYFKGVQYMQKHSTVVMYLIFHNEHLKYLREREHQQT